MSSFRFLHAADIHLDSPLRGLAASGEAASERVRKAPRAAFENLIELALDRQVDFLVIAGDLYDGSWKDFGTGLFFADQMGRLRRAGIRVYLLHGNHDAESEITKPLPLPGNVHVFGSDAAETFTDPDLGVALHGQSYAEPAVTQNLVPGYPQPRSGQFNIGVLHTALGGRPGHANYAPCSLHDLEAKGYDYWALGHVHGREIVSESPWVVFPGNLQGRHARETGPKGAFLVTVNDDRVELEPVDLDVVRWAVIPVGVGDTDDLAGVAGAMSEAMKAEAGRSDGRPLVCRLRLEGPSPIHAELVAADPDHLLAQARATLAGFEDEIAWIEKVQVATQPALDAAALEVREDALGDLLRVLAEAPAASDLIGKLGKDVGVFAERLHQEVRELVEDPVLVAAIGGDYGELIRLATPYLEARLTAEDT